MLTANATALKKHAANILSVDSCSSGVFSSDMSNTSDVKDFDGWLMFGTDDSGAEVTKSCTKVFHTWDHFGEPYQIIIRGCLICPELNRELLGCSQIVNGGAKCLFTKYEFDYRGKQDFDRDWHCSVQFISNNWWTNVPVRWQDKVTVIDLNPNK